MSRDKQDTTQELLIDAALKLFARDGFDGVSVKDICDKAGVNVSLVSYHFGGKEGLYRACLEPFADEQVAFFTRTMKHPKTLEELRFQLRMLLEHIIESWLKHPEVNQIIHAGFDGGDPIVTQLFMKSLFPIFQLVTGVIEEGQKKGFVRKGIDARVAAALLTGGMLQEIRLEKMRVKISNLSLKDEKFRSLLVDNMIEIFMSGISKG